MATPQQIKNWIRDNLPCDRLQVDSDGRHVSVVVVSAKFNGLARSAQHQLVRRALGERMLAVGDTLNLRTLTPEEWRTENG